MKTLLFILLFICSNLVFGQDVENIIVSIQTPYPSYISLDQVIEIAKNKSFEQALDLSESYINIERNSQSSTIVQNDSIASDTYFFNFNVNHSARIIDYEILNTEVIETNGNRVFELEISIDIQSFLTTIDASFTFELDNVKTSFIEGDLFEFTITPNQDGYFSLFVIDGGEVYRIFPNELEKGNYLNAKFKYDFPLSKFIEYELEANKNKVSEFYFVYLKKDVNFSNIKTSKELLKILYSLELNERIIEINPITILKK